MIEGSHIKFAKGIQKVKLTPEEEDKPLFIIREFNNKLIIMLQYIANPEMNICFYDNQLCFLLNAPPENLTVDLSEFLAKKNLKIVPYNSTSKNIKEFIKGSNIEILKGIKEIKKDKPSFTLIRDFDDSINISCSNYPHEINIVLYNKNQLIFSLGCGNAGNLTIDLSGFLTNNNLKIVPRNDIKVPEITEIG